MVLESTQASDQAKAAVQQNSRLLQEKIAEKSKLLSQLDQAKMQEEMNSAMAQLNETRRRRRADAHRGRRRRSRPATPRPRPTPSSTRRRSSRACSRSSRPPPTSRPRAASAELRAELGLDGGSPATPQVERGPAEPPRRAPRRPDSPVRYGAADSSRPTSGRQQHEVVAVDDLVDHAVGEVAGVAAGDPCGAGRPRRTPCRGRRRRRRCRATSTVSPSPKRPDDLDDAGRQQARLALDERPPGAVVDRRPRRRRGRRRRSTACAPAAGGRGPRSVVPTDVAGDGARPARPARAALAITVRTPDHDAMRAASSLLAMPPLPRPLPPAPARIDSSGSSTATRVDELRRRRGRAGRRCTGRRGRSAARARRRRCCGRRGRRCGRCRRSGSRRWRWRRSR